MYNSEGDSSLGIRLCDMDLQTAVSISKSPEEVVSYTRGLKAHHRQGLGVQLLNLMQGWARTGTEGWQRLAPPLPLSLPTQSIRKTGAASTLLTIRTRDRFQPSYLIPQ